MQGVFGWRGTVGLIMPSTCERTAWEFYQMAPEGLALHITSVGVSKLTAEHFERALAKVDEATLHVAETGAQFISLLGTPLSFWKGGAWSDELIKRMEKIAKVPVSTTLSNAVNALNALGAKKIAIGWVSTLELARPLKEFMEYHGFEVVNIKCLNHMRNEDIRKEPVHASYTLCKQAYLEATEEADAIYQPCGSFGGPEVIEALEADLGVPVVSTNQAFLWASLKALGINEPVPCYGSLFDTE